MDFIPVLFIVRCPSSLNVARSPDLHLDSSIESKDIVKEVIVVSDRCNPTDDELGVLHNIDVQCICVTGEWEAGVLFEDTNTSRVSYRFSILMVNGI